MKKKTLNLSGKSDPIVISLCLEDGRDSLFLRREWVPGGKPASRYVYTTLEILVKTFGTEPPNLDVWQACIVGLTLPLRSIKSKPQENA